MIELIKSLVKEGFDVQIINVYPRQDVSVASSSPVGSPEEKKDFIQRLKNREKNLKPKKKRINWRTQRKIKEMADSGKTSLEIATELDVDLETVNKHWV